MNVRAPPRFRVVVEVVYDLICPWCFLGIRRLLRLRHRRPDVLVELIWRPFLLNPGMPRGGMNRPDYVARKFGGEERARRVYTSIGEIGNAEGLRFRFDRIRRTPPTIDAHRLVRFATRQGLGDAIVEALFSAHFTDGLDIGDIPTLVLIAAATGINPIAARAFLIGENETDAVTAENLRSHRIGINGVPCFVIAGAHAIAGAQEPEVMERLIDIAALEG